MYITNMPIVTWKQFEKMHKIIDICKLVRQTQILNPN